MNNNIEDSLKRSIEQMPHPSFQQIADTPVVRMQEHDEITRQEKVHVYYHIRGMALACACFMLLIGTGWFTQFRMVYSIVNVDVNPSLEIMVNRRDHVLAVRANNQEARELLEGRNYKGWNITEMMESLADDLAVQGYLTDEKNVILLSVNSKSQKVYGGLQAMIPTAVSQALADYGINPKLFIQKLDKDEELEKQAEQYHISQGKQQFINRMLKHDPSLNEEDLVSMKVETLINLAEKLGISFDEIEVWYEGDKETEKVDIEESQSREPTTAETKKAEEIKIPSTTVPVVTPTEKYDDDDDDERDEGDLRNDDDDDDDEKAKSNRASEDDDDDGSDDSDRDDKIDLEDPDSDDSDSDDSDSDDSDSDDSDSDDSDSDDSDSDDSDSDDSDSDDSDSDDSDSDDSDSDDSDSDDSDSGDSDSDDDD